MSELKQVILLRTDLNMSKGKMIAQGAHASVDAVLSSNKKLVSKWRLMGMKKIALRVDSLEELEELYKKAIDEDLSVSLIQDAGKTEVEPGTKTALAIGPGPEVKIDKITGDLKPL
jgi:PTH2 family peptidyl-tRNA hydrolase